MVKKKVGSLSVSERRKWLERDESETAGKNPPISRQCKLLGISRSGLYYKKKARKTAKEDENIKRFIEEMYAKNPTYGTRRMTKHLKKLGINIGRTRVTRLYRELGLEAIYPRPHTSFSNKKHLKYPYLLKGLKIERPDQVWVSDITYIKMPCGFLYLTVIMDLYSRYIISWRLSTTLDNYFCVEALRTALLYGSAEIFNSDQGVQYTSKDFTNELENAGIRISMDGKGRCFDNIFVERLWRTVKYELIYLYSFETIKELKEGLSNYFYHYNNERLHQSLDYETPASVYFKGNKLRETA